MPVRRFVESKVLPEGALYFNAWFSPIGCDVNDFPSFHTIYFISSAVPLNYKDTESNRYDTEVIEYDIVDQKGRMWGEEDQVIDLSGSKGNHPTLYSVFLDDLVFQKTFALSCFTWAFGHSPSDKIQQIHPQSCPNVSFTSPQSQQRFWCIL